MTIEQIHPSRAELRRPLAGGKGADASRPIGRPGSRICKRKRTQYIDYSSTYWVFAIE